jgi:hypothetical protein
MADKRKLNRRQFTYYMQVLDDATRQIVGYLSDISTGGFKLDCDQRIQVGQDFRLMIQLNSEIADKTSMTFIARSKWCRPITLTQQPSTWASRSSTWRPVTMSSSSACSRNMARSRVPPEAGLQTIISGADFSAHDAFLL